MYAIKTTLYISTLLLFMGCTGRLAEEDPYRTVPTTNNPHMFHGGLNPKTSPF